MRKKDAGSNEENSELERHVDEMMDPKAPDAAAEPSAPKNPGSAPDLPEIDIFADAPEAQETEGGAAAEPAAEEADPEKVGEASAAADNQPPGTEEIIARDPTVDDPAADPVVDEIVSEEGNELLAAQDAEIARAFVGRPATLKEKIGAFFGNWWRNKKARYATLAVLFVAVVAAGSVPTSRYFVLNTAGVRATASLTVLDGTTGLPLKNVAVALGSSDAKTDKNGVAKLSDVKLGHQQLAISRLGFAKVSRTLTLGLGSNPLGEMKLRATGTQLTFLLTDYLSGKPVINGAASSGDFDAKTDKKGKIILTVGGLNPAPRLGVTLSAKGYRDEKVTVDATTANPTAVVMVPQQKEVFVSKQSGKYDVYKIDIDGKNKKLLLGGTGLERSTISLVANPAGSQAALVSSREDKRNADGYLLDTLTLINVSNGSTLTLDSSEQIRIIDWVGNRLVYVKVKAGTSAGNPERYQLISYDFENTERNQLASANYFNDIVSAKGYIYYASSDNYRGGPSQFVRVDPATAGKQTLLTAEIWNILRNSYGELDLAGAQQWYAYHLGDNEAKQLDQPPANTSNSRFYLDGSDGRHALWTDNRDGKGVLLVYDASSKKDKVLATQSGLTYPLRWLNSRVVTYRVVTSEETAEYAVSLDGGQPKKITDVTNVSGLGSWSYY